MIQLKGKLTRLDAGMPRYAFWEMAKENAGIQSYLFDATGVRRLVSTAFRLRPEYESEVVAYMQMLCESSTQVNALYPVLAHLALRPVRLYSFKRVPLLLETDRCWIVYLPNVKLAGNMLANIRRRENVPTNHQP